MQSGERFLFVRRAVRASLRFWGRLEFSIAQSLAFAAGCVALAGAVVVLGGVTEDVTRHDGFSTTDPLHLHWFIEHRSAPLDTVARGLAAFGSSTVLALVAVVAALGLWLIGQKVLLALAPGVALVIAAAGVALGKGIVGRSRPPVALHLVAESDASFPSGHATDTTALRVTLARVAAVFMLRRPLARIVPVAGALLVSGAVGLSRLVLGVHWPTDVVAGWALGTAIALAVTLTVSIAVRLAPDDPEPATKPNPRRGALRVMHHRRHPHSLQAA